MMGVQNKQTVAGLLLLLTGCSGGGKSPITKSESADSSPRPLPPFATVINTEGSPYRIETVRAENNREYRAFKDDHHFLSVIQAGQTLVVRPHPGADENGWGSSWVAQAFMPGARFQGTQLENLVTTNDEISVTSSGQVSGLAGGDWSMLMTYRYNASEKKITGDGVYTITILALNGDLNLYKIASNYLEDVPILRGGRGNTGDMARADYTRNDGTTVQWVPTSGNHFPQDIGDKLVINVVENYNEVDTVAQNSELNPQEQFERIAPAYKPSISIGLTSKTTGIDMIFGAVYDESFNSRYGLKKSQLFFEDNVGITPLILRRTTKTKYDFDITFESVSGE